MIQGLALCCITFVLTLIAMRSNARIDSDSILAFLCIALLHLVTKKSRKYEYFRVSQAQHNATQGPCVILWTGPKCVLSLTNSFPCALYASISVMQRWQVHIVHEQVLLKQWRVQRGSSESRQVIAVLSLCFASRFSMSPIIIHVTNQHRCKALFCTICTPSNYGSSMEQKHLWHFEKWAFKIMTKLFYPGHCMVHRWIYHCSHNSYIRNGGRGVDVWWLAFYKTKAARCLGGT